PAFVPAGANHEDCENLLCPFHVASVLLRLRKVWEKTKETLMEELNTILYTSIFEVPSLSWWDMQVKLSKIIKSFIERVCGGLPTSSAYVPGSTSGLTDHMTFVQRLENWLLYAMSGVTYLYFILPEWDEYYSKVLVCVFWNDFRFIIHNTLPPK
ncbi:hypothetical protein HPG69_001433, partial [Diceros bicornis minor]